MNIIKQENFKSARGWDIKKTLVEHNGKHYVISEAPSECLIFPSDSEGNCNYIEVGSAESTSDALSKIIIGQILS